jgi:hypothetical protein
VKFPIQAAAVIRRATSLSVRRLPDGVVGLQTQRHPDKDLEVFGFDHSKDCPAGKFWCYCNGLQAYACCSTKPGAGGALIDDGSQSCNQTGTGTCDCI